MPIFYDHIYITLELRLMFRANIVIAILWFITSFFTFVDEIDLYYRYLTGNLVSVAQTIAYIYIQTIYIVNKIQKSHSRARSLQPSDLDFDLNVQKVTFKNNAFSLNEITVDPSNNHSQHNYDNDIVLQQMNTNSPELAPIVTTVLFCVYQMVMFLLKLQFLSNLHLIRAFENDLCKILCTILVVFL